MNTITKDATVMQTANQKINSVRWAAVIVAAILLHAVPAWAQSYTIAPTPFQVVQDDSGNIVVGGCVWTYVAGTTTPIATYSNNSGTVNSNPIQADYAGRFTAYLLAGTNYKFTYESACTPPAHGSVLRSADNIAGSPAAAATVDMTCTAGETLSAGTAAYLSDGSGSKTQGLCYKADSANAYSSSGAVVIGMVPSAITSGSTGTLRISGLVSGLSSLTVGAPVYVGSSGALTTTAPNNPRKLGSADTSASVVLSMPAATVANGVDDFRLTLEQGVPVSFTDQTAKTTIYATPYRGNRIALFDAAGVASTYSSAEFSIAVPATTSQMYDIFAFASSGAPALELLAWTNDTTRATAIVLTTTGTYTKSGDLTRRYLGSFRTTAVSGQTEDSVQKRFLWNMYNRARRQVKASDAANSWTYTTATIRQAHATATNQIDVVQGVAESLIDLSLNIYVANGSGALIVEAGIGEDSTTTFSANQYGQMYLNILVALAAVPQPLTSRLALIPAVGRHFYSWNEYSQANATTTWYSSDPLALSNQRGGLIGWWEN